MNEPGGVRATHRLTAWPSVRLSVHLSGLRMEPHIIDNKTRHNT